jgi:hypothetical protein
VFVPLIRFENTGIFPVPLAGFTLETPAGTLACQANVTLGVVELRVTATELDPLQMDWFATAKVVTGAGFTVMEYVPVVPLQLFAVGIMV